MENENLNNNKTDKQTDVQSHQDAELYSSIIQNSLEGFWLVDKSGVIIDVNKTACQMLGYSKDELTRMQVSQITTYKNAEEIKKQIESSLTLKEEKFYSNHTRKDKHVIDVEVCTSTLKKTEMMLSSLLLEIFLMRW